MAPPTTRTKFDLLAVDLDGTLLRSDKQVSTSSLTAVRAAIEQGTRVVIASARPPRSSRAIYEQLGLDTLQINYNGALIFDPPARRVFRHEPIPGPVARAVVELGRSMHAELVVSLEVLDRWITDRVDPAYLTATAQMFGPDGVCPLDPHLDNPVTKLMLHGPPPVLEPIGQAIVDWFGDRVSVHVSDRDLLQVVRKGVDKSYALETICGHYGIEAERVVAIGDAPNDIGMLNWAGLAIAVGNAWDITRAAADVTVPANDEDGVAHAIERHVLA